MLLSICIPTYNRCDKVLALLRFLSSELENNVFVNDIEIIVSDNCSTDDTKDRVLQFTEGSNFFIYHRNQSNLGLIGKWGEISWSGYIWIRYFIYFKEKRREKKSVILEKDVGKLVEHGIIKQYDIQFIHIGLEKYANIIFTEPIYEARKIVRDYLSSVGVETIGRFVEWDYLCGD